MIHKPLGINKIATKLNQAFLKTDRQSDPAERRNFLPIQKFQPGLFPGKNILKIKRAVHTLNDASRGIVSTDFTP